MGAEVNTGAWKSDVDADVGSAGVKGFGCSGIGVIFWNRDLGACGASATGDGARGPGAAGCCIVGDFEPLELAGAPKDNFGDSLILPKREFCVVAVGGANEGAPKLKVDACICPGDVLLIGAESMAEVEGGAISRTGEGARCWTCAAADAFLGGDIIMVSSVSCGAVLEPKENADFSPPNKLDGAGSNVLCPNMDEVDDCGVLSPNANLVEVCEVAIGLLVSVVFPKEKTDSEKSCLFKLLFEPKENAGLGVSEVARTSG